MTDITLISPAFTMTVAPHWVAIDKGFFREEGLIVSCDYILDKKTDNIWVHSEYKDRIVFMAPGGSRPFYAAKSGWQEISVICTQDRPAHVLIARPEIKTIADLKGKRIIAGFLRPSQMDARVVLKRYGLDPEKDVTWINSTAQPPDTERRRVEALSKGEADAMASGPPHWAMGVKMGLRRLPSARDFEIRPEDGLSTSPRIIKERPDVVKGVVRALIRGTEFVRLNKEETLDILQRHIIYADRDTLSYCYDSIHQQFYVISDEEPYEDMARLYEELYGLDHKPLVNYFNFTFVREALEELRLFRKPSKSQN